MPAPPMPAPPKADRRTPIAIGLATLVVAAAGITTAVVLAHGGNNSPQATSPSPTPLAATTHPAAHTSSSAHAADFATIYAREQSGVVRIEVLGCSESGIGTGFLLSPTLVATVNHVVRESVVVSLVDGSQRTTGRVIGTDPAKDLALVRADEPLDGFHFRFAAAPPRIGDRVAAVGFPIGDPITLTQGGVSGLDRSISIDGRSYSGLIETDAAINPGNSGGPLINADGDVTGLVDAQNTEANGIGYAVPASDAAPAMTRWPQSPRPLAPAECRQPLGPDQDVPDIPAVPGLGDEASVGITTAFDTYFNGINTGDYASAYYVLSPRLRAGSTLDAFAAGDATSYDFDQTILAAHQLDASTAIVALEFTSLQDSSKGPNGDTCDVWTLRYTMIEISRGSWYIDATKPYRGRSHTAC